MLNPRIMKNAESEMKRRQQAVLQAMKKEGVDCLVMYTFGDLFGGTFRYLTDDSSAYPITAIMCAEGIAYFGHGGVMPTDDVPDFKPGGEKLPVSRWNCPVFPGTTFLDDRNPSIMVRFIKKHNFKKIGWIGRQYIPFSVGSYLVQNLPGVEFVDFSAQLNEIRLVKSPYEIGRWMSSVEMHDKLIDISAAMIRPGMTVYQHHQATMKTAMDLGAIEFYTGSVHLFRDDKYIGNYDVDEPYKVGDYIYQLIECAGPGGEWAECARFFRVGEEPEEKWNEIIRNICAVQDATAAACKPGAIPQDVFRLGNKMLIEFGYEPEARIFAHGQTYDIVDLPLFVEGDVTPLLENTFINIHPSYRKPGGGFLSHTDNYLIEKDGARLLSKTPRKIITVPVY